MGLLWLGWGAGWLALLLLWGVVTRHGLSALLQSRAARVEAGLPVLCAKFEAIQFLRDGEAFGAGPTSAEGFDDEEVEASTADGDDDIMF